MRKVITTLIATLFFVVANAQQFNGVKLSGTRKDFTNQYLQSRTSASVVYKVETETAIKDKFLGSNVTIYVQRHYQSTTDDVWTIWLDIILPKSADWASMTKRYNEVLAELTKQYGEPHPWLKSRKFEYPYSNGNHIGKEINALKSGKCKYSDTFFFDGWRLGVSLEYVEDIVNNTTYNSIMLSYSPKQ